ncbi:MAG: hypothetical protein ACRDG7_18540 [Candidatus Limnocylindria bacterium]
MVTFRVSLFEKPDSVATVAHAIAEAGGRLRSLSTVRALPDINVVELELCVEHLNAHSVAAALRDVAGILMVGLPSGAPLLERRQIRIGGRVRWPEGRAPRAQQR